MPPVPTHIPISTMTIEQLDIWFTARCVRVRAVRTCVFCGNDIVPSGLIVPNVGKLYAHYNCTPGLGAEIPEHLAKYRR